ncbi:hypothetical protein ID866_9480 [Astraeus odoratus]|nr:hypothetical protein ID866_9480 [Astraeus odoratus]
MRRKSGYTLQCQPIWWKNTGMTWGH